MTTEDIQKVSNKIGMAVFRALVEDNNIDFKIIDLKIKADVMSFSITVNFKEIEDKLASDDKANTHDK